MSAPTMNHNSHMHQREEQQQQQQQQEQQQINEVQHVHSNLANSSHATLIRSDSTSTVILEEEENIRTRQRNGLLSLPPSLRKNLSIRLRSMMKTSGLFNKDFELSDKFNELFGGDNEFTLQKLLSEAGANDITIDMDELMKCDTTKSLDSRTLSEFLRSESFDQLMASTTNNVDMLTNPPAIACSTRSFSELRPVSPELITNTIFGSQSNQLTMETDHSLIYNPTNSLITLNSLPVSSQLDPNQGALNAFEHDHAFFSKRTPNKDTSTVTNSKQTSARRTSSRIQSRTTCSALSSSSDSNSVKTNRGRNVNRATDIKTEDDLSYYLERRRKNNEASKVSRAARKQKFGDMDHQCEEYERVNGELRIKIKTLELVTSTLKRGLVNNFQPKTRN